MGIDISCDKDTYAVFISLCFRQYWSKDGFGPKPLRPFVLGRAVDWRDVEVQDVEGSSSVERLEKIADALSFGGVVIPGLDRRKGGK